LPKRIQGILTLTAVFALLAPLFPLQKHIARDLPPKYKKWLEEEVFYIISEVEKEVFLQLSSDRERDLFTEAFWKQRDPTPGTPENQFKDEHYRRFNYANSYLGRGVPKPGWKTHRGEIYIILGEPIDIQRYSGEDSVYDTEIWFYQGLTEYGLPAAFNLLFFQKEGAGEHILYSPIGHGPQALMMSFRGDQANYQVAFRKLREIDPVLAQTSISLIPGEPVHYGQPSLSSDILINKVYAAPQKQIKDRYAEKFLAYKDIVEVDYSANYIDSDSSVKIIQDSSGINFVHYMIELTKFSMQQYENKYSTHLKLNGNVSDKEGNMVYQYEGSFTVNLDESRLRKVANRPFNLYDMFPLLPGHYNFSVILKNEVSKEFTTFERELVVPEDTDDSQVRMGELILGYKRQPNTADPQKLAPFRIGLDQIYHQPQNIFHPQEELTIVFQAKGLNPEHSLKGEARFEFYREDELFTVESRKVADIRRGLNFITSLSLRNFLPAHYKLKVSIWNNEQEIVSQWEELDISPVAAMPRPWTYNKELPPPNSPVYDFILGKQYLNKNKIEEAKSKLEAAYNRIPGSQDFALELARVYLVQKNFKDAKETLLPFSKKERPPYQVFLLLGQSHYALAEYGQAVDIYNKAISHFGTNTHLLNNLGECYTKLELMEEALAAWNASLEINPDQPDIRKKMESIKK